ncbi:hypothetical protein [Phytoactinopolyspora endophytica]|uniref:hypothetical protein n=1 Tax=Phytoactinopolyspora endophytica TaxID=1642495 RepID=UPI00101CBAFA|nr:hypothetical protein [Phytoactinopolyspora endophytica]
MDVDEAVAELYGLVPDEFVAARNAMAKRAKAENGREAAAQIQALRKPTLAAWLANQLVRQHGADLRELLTVGDDMRDATAASDGQRLRELTSRRKELVDGLLIQARRTAEEAGLRAGDDAVEALNETLLAATADPRAAAQVEAGRLTHPLQHVGFGPFGAFGGDADVISLSEVREARGQRTRPADTAAGAGAKVDDGRRAKTKRPKADRDGDKAAEDVEEDAERERRLAREREEAEDELRAAEKAVEAASDRVEAVLTRLDERRRVAERAESEVERLTAELESARRDLDHAQADVHGAEEELDEARSEAEAALRRRQTAKRRLP